MTSAIEIGDTVAVMNFDGVKELFSTGKGVLVVILIVAVSVLFGLGSMTMDQWKASVVWLFGVYAAASAVRGGMTALANRTVHVVHAGTPIAVVSTTPTPPAA